MASRSIRTNFGAYDFILLSSVSGVANEWRFTRAGETVAFSAPLDRARETNDGALARDWAVEGRGLAMKSIWDIGADLREGQLRILLPEWRCPDVPVTALFQRNRYMEPRVRALLDFLDAKVVEAAAELEGFLR